MDSFNRVHPSGGGWRSRSMPTATSTIAPAIPRVTPTPNEPALENAEVALTRTQNVLLHTPVINILSQFFFITPSFDDLTRLLNTFAILAALVLGLVIAMACATPYSDLLEADERFKIPANRTEATGYQKYQMAWEGVEGMKASDPRLLPSQRFATCLIISMNFMTCSLMTNVVLYTFMMFGGFDMENATRRKVQERNFFRLIRVIVLFALLFTVAGVVLFFTAAWYLILIRFPDYVLEENGYVPGRGIYQLAFICSYTNVFMVLLCCIVGGIAVQRSHAAVVTGNPYGIRKEDL